MKDFFQPTTEPAKTLYKAFQKEALKRNKRTFKEWNEAEINAVYNAAQKYAKKHEMNGPTLEQVRNCEKQNVGYTDYASKWALYVAKIMEKK